jgi:hypothetical protein
LTFAFVVQTNEDFIDLLSCVYEHSHTSTHLIHVVVAKW